MNIFYWTIVIIQDIYNEIIDSFFMILILSGFLTVALCKLLSGENIRRILGKDDSFYKKGSFWKCILFSIAMSGIIVLTLIARKHFDDPFANVIGNWQFINKKYWSINKDIVENILLYVPLGFSFCLFINDAINVLKFSFLFSFTIENLQIIFSLGTFQFSDITFNTLGGVAGYVCYRIGILLYVKIRYVWNHIWGK